MKGVMFNILEKFVVDNFGEENWEEVLDESGSDGTFVGPKTYDDSIFMKIMMTAITLNKIAAEDAIRKFGSFAFPYLAHYGQDMIKDYKDPVDLLMDLDSIIHVEVKKLMEGAEPPKFIAEKIDQNTVKMNYISRRNLPSLVEGLMEGLAHYYSRRVSYESGANEEGGITFLITFK